jgi:hypothetical protein
MCGCVYIYWACVAYGVPACARAPRQNTLAAPECMFESRLSFRCSRGNARTFFYFIFYFFSTFKVKLEVCFESRLSFRCSRGKANFFFLVAIFKGWVRGMSGFCSPWDWHLVRKKECVCKRALTYIGACVREECVCVCERARERESSVCLCICIYMYIYYILWICSCVEILVYLRENKYIHAYIYSC